MKNKMKPNKANNENEILEKINYIIYLLGQNSSLKRRQPRNVQIINPPPRNKTPNFTRIKSPLIRNKNLNEYKRGVQDKPNHTLYSSNNKNKSKDKERHRYNCSPSMTISNNNTRNIPNIIHREKNISFPLNSNDKSNYSVNYTMRSSNYSNMSNSGISNFTTNRLDEINSKYQYYKVLFQQVKGHNLALLNKLKDNKKLNEIVEDLEKENKKLKNENKKLLQNKDYNANSDEE